MKAARPAAFNGELMMAYQDRARVTGTTCLWVMGLLLLAPPVWAADPQPAEAAIAQRLAKLKQQYQAVSSIQFKTSNTLSASQASDAPPALVMRAACSYWAGGENYRTETKITPLRGSPNEWITAYDGARWQMFEQKTSRLVYRKTNVNQQPTCLPNPLLAPLAFLRPSTGEKGVKLLWSEAQSPAFWDVLGRDVQVVGATDDGQGLFVELRGRLSDGTAFVSRIRFGTHPDYLPTEIDWIPEGKATLRYRLEQYERHVIDGQESYWPRQVRLALSDPMQPTTGELVTNIEELKLNAKIPADLFTLDFTKPTTIYDDDMQAFVKTRGGYRVSPSVLAVEGTVAIDDSAATANPEISRKAQPAAQDPAATPRVDPPSIPAAPLADARYLGLRWAGLIFTGIGVVLLAVYFRARRADRLGSGS